MGDHRPSALLLMNAATYDEAFRDDARTELETLLDLRVPLPVTHLDLPDDVVERVEILVTSWGVPRLDDEALARMPKLRAIFHAAGTIRPFLSPGALESGVTVCAAADANAGPVAEFTFAQIILALKRVGRLADRYRTQRRPRDLSGMPVLGTHGVTVGVVGASRVGRKVVERLHTIDARVLLADPYVEASEARELGAEPVPLDELCARSDVVTLHAPLTPSTIGLVGERQLALMRDGAVLVNTARGGIVDHAALTPHVVSGRLDAWLDVTDPEPLPDDSPLWDLPNVALTPHLAGALGNEVSRLGDQAMAELRRYLDGRPLRHQIQAADLARIA
ncbi:hydroxyacid dehydrogenase [Isoptericola hypogeus]|uniref:Hydroxyacid dehydrogenase n=1 Tax=Isoptericola hypogeus TaxID=300179 RepID=A0ABN2JI26_9MICO